MLHISQEDRLKIIKDRIDQYHIRFPVATLNKETGEDQGNISKMLKGKKPISDKFFTSFIDKFPEIKKTNPSNMDQVLPLGDLKITMKDYFNLLLEQKTKAEEREKDYLEIIKSKLISIDTSSKEIVEDLQALTNQTQAANRAIMDSIDVAAKQPTGTTRAAARIVEIAFQEEQMNKDRKVGTGKKDKPKA